MAEESQQTDQEKTEPPSARRLEQAREQGQVARSIELSTFAVLLAAVGTLVATGPAVVASLAGITRAMLSFDPAAATDPSRMAALLGDASGAALLALAPVFLVALAAALVAPMLVSGWLFTFESLRPQWMRISPLTNVKRLFSAYGAVEFAKAIAKAVLIGGIVLWAGWQQMGAIVQLSAEPLAPALAQVANLIIWAVLAGVAGMAVIAAVDVPFQIWNFRRELRMTRQELERELKETEGDPQIRARVRSLQREAARRRMMAEVPRADVVVINPTRYAAALRYQEGRMAAPQVVALGTLAVAERIVELAREHQVPVVRCPPLARALWRHADLGAQIPAPLYAAVAEVLAYVYQLRLARDYGTAVPPEPAVQSVPAGLDPGPDPDEDAGGTQAVAPAHGGGAR
jgi:flagellar biosynthetic protein FlhB